MGTTSSEPG